MAHLGYREGKRATGEVRGCASGFRSSKASAFFLNYPLSSTQTLAVKAKELWWGGFITKAKELRAGKGPWQYA
jgi:hypothetical protein